MELKIKRCSTTAKLPAKAYEFDAGLDLYNNLAEDILLDKGRRYLFPTGISLEIPSGYYGDIRDRSGNAVKRGLHVMAGIVDSSYRGEVMVCLINLGEMPIKISPADKIAQMLILPVPRIEIVEVNELSETKRGEKGFGSSDENIQNK